MTDPEAFDQGIAAFPHRRCDAGEVAFFPEHPVRIDGHLTCRSSLFSSHSQSPCPADENDGATPCLQPPLNLHPVLKLYRAAIVFELAEGLPRV